MSHILLPLAIALSFFIYPREAHAAPHSVLKYNLKATLLNAGVDDDARGTVSSTLIRNSSGEKQGLKIVLARLEPNTTYALRAFVGNDSAPTSVTVLTTDRRGGAVMVFTKDRRGRATGRTLLLPPQLDPLCKVRALEIVDGAGRTVLGANLVVPTRRSYLVARPLENSGFISSAAGTLRITASQRHARFQLRASGLSPATDYVVYVNGNAGQTVTSGGSGNLRVLALPGGFSNPFDIHTVALRDTSGNIVLSTGEIGIPCVHSASAPTVSSTIPGNGATDVALNQTLAASFNQAMDPATITTSTFTLTGPGGLVAGTVAYDANSSTATFVPGAPLAPSTVYGATITTGARDLAGNAVASDVVWNFTTGTASDTTAPTVSSTVPADAANGVSVNSTVASTFSEAMNPSTITPSTFTLTGPGGAVTGTVAYDVNSRVATFSPGSALAASTTYTATITTGVQDLAGNPLATSRVWTFTTGAAQDTTPPTVSSTAPANAATGVSVNQTLVAIFNEAMNPSTISASTFTLSGPGGQVAGTVAYDANSRTATLDPGSALAANTTYNASITTGAQDLAGNPLTSNFVWSFTTAGSSAGQQPVALGSAGAFAILAGSTVTSSGFTVINNGDVGVSPGTAVDGFPPAAINNGAIHAADSAASQAKLDLTSAYNEAAGRSVSPVTLAGNLGGQTLTPGLYKSTSSLEISAGDLTLDALGDANAVFVFQIASTLTTTSDRKIFLTGGAKAANVYWQVGTSATLGTISVFKGNILADQSITLTTGANLEGRALTRIGAVTLDSSTVTNPAP